MAAVRATGSLRSDRGDELGDVVFFGTYDELVHPRIQVLREGLAAHGASITVLNEPLGIGTAQRVEMLSGPLRLGKFCAVMARRWLRLVRRARRLTSSPEVVVVGYLGHFDVRLARLLFRHSTIVLDHMVGLSDTARDRRLDRRRLVTGLLGAIDRQAMAAADVVVFDTPEHRDYLGAGVPCAIVVPVGAPTKYVDAGDTRTDLREDVLRVLFFGLFTPLQGATTIGRAISLLRFEPGVRFTIVGEGQDWAEAHDAAKDSPHVTWIRWVAPGDVPTLIAGHDVCLGIFGTTPKARRVVPNKVYQGLAAGSAVVTSDTPSQRRVLGSAPLYVAAGNPEALAQALRDLHTDRERLRTLQENARDLAKHSFTPEAVTRELASLLRRRRALERQNPVQRSGRSVG